jgi:hypothetical protein
MVEEDRKCDSCVRRLTDLLLIEQPPVPANAVTSDESSTEGNAYSIVSRRQMPTVNSQVVDMSAPQSFEPIQVSVPRSTAPSSMEPYPVNHPVMSQQFNALGQVNMFANITASFAQFAPNPVRSQADQVLDDAVDELFSDDPLMNETRALDGLWDATAFGEEGVQDDLQLGFMLEKLLEA